jgi:hypothetical protein
MGTRVPARPRIGWRNMSHLASGGDSYRPAGGYTTRFSDLRARTDGDSRVDRVPDGPLSVQGMRDLARDFGLDLGSEREDNEDLEHVAKHEAGHAVAAWALGWEIQSVDARAGQTRFVFRPDQLIADRDREFATIAAAGCEGTGSYVDSSREELADDRHKVRKLTGSYTAFDDARPRARKLLSNPEAKRFYNRVVDALIARKVLTGADLAELDNE